MSYPPDPLRTITKPGGQVGGFGNGERDNALRDAEPKADSFYFFETLLGECHPSSKMFYDHLLEAALLHKVKQADYGKTEDPFANVRASEEWGIPGWVGACIRLNDKVRRLQTLANKGELVNESVKDSFLDIAVYSLIALCLYQQDLTPKG